MATELLGRFGIKLSHNSSNGSVLTAATDSMVAVRTVPEYTATSRVLLIRGQRETFTQTHSGSSVSSSPPFICTFQEPRFPPGCDIFNISILRSIWWKFHYCSSRCRENANHCVGRRASILQTWAKQVSLCTAPGGRPKGSAVSLLGETYRTVPAPLRANNTVTGG